VTPTGEAGGFSLGLAADAQAPGSPRKIKPLRRGVKK
jgi:hypothetical protein